MLADIHAKDTDRAAGRARHAVDHAQSRRFAGAVGAQKPEADMPRNLEIEMVDGQPFAEFF